MPQANKIAVIVVAGGRGERAGAHASGLAKQYWPLLGRPVIAHACAAFLAEPNISRVQPVVGAADLEFVAALDLGSDDRLLPAVAGGETRQQSVRAGLEALAPHAPDLVLIHDAARPLVSHDVVSNAIAGLQDYDAVLPAIAVTDTIKRSEDGVHISRTEDRASLFAAQTPQGFRFDKILAAHRQAANESFEFTDDTAIAEWAGMKVVLSQGSPRNIKITLPGDLQLAEFFVGEQALTFETRVGSGADIHAFAPGDKITLGGIDIAHDKRLKGHSDADAGLHVLTDALLGALAEGDIGQHFPPGDPKWQGAPSRIFLAFAAERVKQRGGRIVHLDLTIIAEQPKIGPHVQAMRQSIAAICAIAVERVSVKATTSEQMGFVGREEGLMTMGNATIELPRGKN